MLTELRAKHSVPAEANNKRPGLMWGINGNTQKIELMDAANIWDPCAVKI
jgi:hypothetical protein